MALHADAVDEALADNAAVAVPLALQSRDDGRLLVGLPLIVIVVNKRRADARKRCLVRRIDAIHARVLHGVLQHRCLREPERPVDEVIADHPVPVTVSKTGLGLVRQLDRLVDDIPRVNLLRVALAINVVKHRVDVALEAFKHRVAVNKAHRIQPLHKAETGIFLQLLLVHRNKHRLVLLAKCLLRALAVPYHHVGAHFQTVRLHPVKHLLGVRVDHVRQVVLARIRAVPSHVVRRFHLVRARHARELAHDQCLLVRVADLVVGKLIVDALHRRSDLE